MQSLAGLFAAATAFAFAGAASGAPIDETYTLYRNSVLDTGMRLHVATFDAVDGGAYNRENCDQARELFQAQPGIKTKFWCERGRFQDSASAQQPKLGSRFTTEKGPEITCSASSSEPVKPAGSRRLVNDGCPR
jgi:hypothetical protein